MFMMKSYAQAGLVMLLIPLGFIGAVAGHYIRGIPVSFISFLGSIALAGIIINDSVVLIDCYNNLVRIKKLPDEEAIYRAGMQRFRPIVMTTLTTVRRQCFQQIHRPVDGITPGTLLEGLIEFRRLYRGEIWLEVMLLQGINSADEHVEQLRRVVEAIGPDRVQLNTVVRPPADLGARSVSPRRMQQLRRLLGPKAEVIADYSGAPAGSSSAVGTNEVLALLSRRPCRVLDVAAGLSMAPNQVVKLLTQLQQEGRITSRRVESRRFYQTERTTINVGVR